MELYENASITDPNGFRANAVHAGFKRKDPDLCIIVSDVPAVVSAKFTRNAVKAAPVLKGMEGLRASGNRLQGLVINSGNANAATGEQGLAAVDRTLEYAGLRLGVPKELLLMSSTGLIGVQLDMERMLKGVDSIVDAGLDKASGKLCARAIMTTDTREKAFGLRIKIKGKPVVFAGITKGAGMIAPNMATTLSFVTTDLNISEEALDQAFTKAVNSSFNMITIDGHMSTNDTALVMANGMAGNERVESGSAEYDAVEQALGLLMTEMAMAVVRDGEGATKFVKVTVADVKGFSDAKKMAFGIANSVLVKTAIFGQDPNWGRILSAAGMVGVDFDPDRASVAINGVKVYENGVPKQDLKPDLMAGDMVEILVTIGTGDKRAEVFTSDLSYEYVRINAEYHT